LDNFPLHFCIILDLVQGFLVLALALALEMALEVAVEEDGNEA
jgi:hypothetical protein